MAFSGEDEVHCSELMATRRNLSTPHHTMLMMLLKLRTTFHGETPSGGGSGLAGTNRDWRCCHRRSSASGDLFESCFAPAEKLKPYIDLAL
jgi:hypothetical protein